MENLQPKYKIGDEVYYLIQFGGTPFSCIVRMTIKSYTVLADRILYETFIDKKWKPFLKKVDPVLRDRVAEETTLIECDLMGTPEEAAAYGLSHYKEIVRNIECMSFQ